MIDVETILKQEIEKATPNILNEIKALNLNVKTKRKISYSIMKYSISFACSLLIVGFISLIYLQNNAITTLAIDINPSIEIDINYFDKVVDVRGINEEGKEFVSLLDIEGKDINQIGEDIIKIATENEYFINDGNNQVENAILITVKGMFDNKSIHARNSLANNINLNLHNDYKTMNIKLFEGNYKDRFELFEKKEFNHVSIPKLNLIQAILHCECSDSCTLDRADLIRKINELSELSISELITELEVKANIDIHTMEKNDEHQDWPMPLFPNEDCDCLPCYHPLFPLIPRIIEN